MYNKYRKYKAKYLEKKLEISQQEDQDLEQEPEQVEMNKPEEEKPQELTPEVVVKNTTGLLPYEVITLKNGKTYKKYDFSKFVGL